ncbi:MAG: hypothetical protein JNN32_12625 [Flavobacteriales bacterium]|nr:hypothetical protein [Flavobacteriales bacterium]
MKHLYTIVLGCAISANANAQLSGTKTIGGANPDFATVTAAVNALMNQGATGNVTFSIRPGTYTGRYDIGAVPGSPGAITFKSENNDASTVVLEHDASSSADNSIFRIDGTDGVALQALTLRAVDPFLARAVVFLNDIQILTIMDCVIEGSADPNQNSGFERALLWCEQNNLGNPDNPQDVMVLDNIFRNGYEGINFNFEGDFGNRSEGLIITGNTFTDQYATGITVANAVGQIGDNLLTTDVGVFYVGIRTNYFDGGSQIRRNQVRAYATTGGCNGIECGNTQNTTGNMISNNMIYCNAPGDVWGLAVYNLWDMKIVHNSVLVAAGNGAQTHAFYHISNFADGQDALVRNNIFANHAGGPAYTVNVAGNVATEDHNCLYTVGNTISGVGGNAYATIAAHQSGTGQGTGDTDTDPVFPIQPDLHLNDCTGDLAGQYFFVSASDIDGDARGNPVCDMGADEFTFSATIDAGTFTIAVNDLPYTLTAPNGTVYDWNQGSTTQSIQVVTAGLYDCVVTDVNGCTYTVSWTVNVDFSTGLITERSPVIGLYPVPATSTLNIVGLPAGARYEVIDAQGRCLLHGAYVAGSRLDVGELKPGVHLMRWSEGTVAGTVRFIKQ